MNFQLRLFLAAGVSFYTAKTSMALVPPTTIFQLDGNAANSNLSCSYGSCDYWNQLNGTGNNVSGGGLGAGSSAGHSLIRSFVNGTSSTNAFTTGGSKDANVISQWAYSSTPTPNKDTLNAAYAAAYQVGGDFELIFGANRLSPNGDANIGIWFFQDKVGPDGNGKFTGSHMDHDIFAISSFTGGGGNATIQVLEWDHTCASGVKNPGIGQCADTNLRLLANVAANSVCTSTSAYCATTNSAATNTTWGGSVASPLFFVGGVDITAALSGVGVSANLLPCFSSFLIETRSSQSTTAVLKDFVGGTFPVCGMTISKACGTVTANSAGTSITFPVTGLVTNTGVGNLYGVTVFDTVNGATKTISVANNVSGSSFFGTATLGPGETGFWSDSTTANVSSLTDTAIAKAKTSSTDQAFSVTSSDPAAQATCSFSASTTLSVTKACTTSLQAGSSSVNVVVNYSGQVCNYGPGQVTGVVLTDTPSSGASATINVGSLAPCATYDSNGTCTVPSCSPYSSSYTPTGIDTTVNGGTGPGRYFWSDSIAITSATVTLAGDTLTKLATGACTGTYGCSSASCPICQSGECTLTP